VSGQIHESTGASIVTRGMYKQIGESSPDQTLHLHVSADSQDKVDLAVKRIKEMMISEPLKVLSQSHHATNMLSLRGTANLGGSQWGGSQFFSTTW
jgi:hypothetical protein